MPRKPVSRRPSTYFDRRTCQARSDTQRRDKPESVSSCQPSAHRRRKSRTRNGTGKTASDRRSVANRPRPGREPLNVLGQRSILRTFKHATCPSQSSPGSATCTGNSGFVSRTGPAGLRFLDQHFRAMQRSTSARQNLLQAMLRLPTQRGADIQNPTPRNTARRSTVAIAFLNVERRESVPVDQSDLPQWRIPANALAPHSTSRALPDPARAPTHAIARGI